jgi:hypothetical protein
MPAEPLQFDNYVVPVRADGTLWELGRGAMGITYRAFDTRLRVDVVLKIIKQDLLTSERARFLFLREARAAAKVRHPNIAAVITLHDSEPFYYTMEFVAGNSLAELLKSRAPFTPGEALDYTDQIAAALNAMSREQIVHRDLKPANIMAVPDDDRPFGVLLKVIDFGLAKGFTAGGVDPETHLRSLTNWSIGFSGTVAYASPEQCAELPDIDGRSDLYSLGVVLWQMLIGKLPFTGTLSQISSMHQSKEPPWEQLATIPEPVISILRKLLAKEPEGRFNNARELRDVIASTFALLGPGNDRRKSDRSNKPEADSNLETQQLAPVAETVRLGTTVAERYTVAEQVVEGDGGKLFKGADNRGGGALVAIKLLDPKRASDDEFCAKVRNELDQVLRNPHPIFLSQISGLLRSGFSTFYVREWAAGFSLDDLLRARNGQITAPELWRLLETLPAALDFAASQSLSLAEPLLRKLFVCPPIDAKTADDWPSLRFRQISEWPDFRLRWNSVSFRSTEQETAAAATRVQSTAVSATEDRVRALALLVRELLGGRPGQLTPLPALTDETNAILQRALISGGGAEAFGSAGAFWDALAKSFTASSNFRSSAAVSVRPARTIVPADVPSKQPSLPRIVLIGAIALIVVGAGTAWFIGVQDRKLKRLERTRQTQVRDDSERAAREAAAREKQETDRLAREKELQEQLEKEKAARIAAEQRTEEKRQASAARPAPTSIPAPVASARESANVSATRSKPFVNSLGIQNRSTNLANRQGRFRHRVSSVARRGVVERRSPDPPFDLSLAQSPNRTVCPQRLPRCIGFRFPLTHESLDASRIRS